MVPFANGTSNTAIEQLKGYAVYNKPVIACTRPPTPSFDNSVKWWSVNFVKSAHTAIMTAALGFINKAELPDIARAQSILLTGTNDESGHQPDQNNSNGGKPNELWLGKTRLSNGGVLWNYEHFKFREAYARLGTICHLTQDMAVPTHAANISHATGDPFEAYTVSDKNVQIKTSRDKRDAEPYAYYQELQDETRSHLSLWVSPKTKKPYWIPAKDAPPPGQDATFGSWGSYGESYTEPGAGFEAVAFSPEIRVRQLAMAGEYTIAVLKSASHKLPPLVSNLSVTAKGKSRTLKFRVFDNSSRSVSYKVLLSRKGTRPSTLAKGDVMLSDPAPADMVLGCGVVFTFNVSRLIPGSYKLEVILTDSDGNTTPDEVNFDDIHENDTRVQIAIP